MRTIVHLSDLHFGSIHPATLDPLVRAVETIAPDLVIMSGDFTQRARVVQYKAAREFMQRLPSPQLVIPGNHDVPLYDVVRRFAQPLRRYRRYITRDLSPVFRDEELLVVGVNSARSLTFKGGRLNHRQVAHAAAEFDRATPGQAKIFVTHHPFDVPIGITDVDRVGGAAHAVRTMADCSVDMFLAGHLHLIHVVSAEQYKPGYAAPLIHAGTATSTRTRGHPNSFFVIRVEADQFVLQTRNWNGLLNNFVLSGEQRFARAVRPATSATPSTAR